MDMMQSQSANGKHPTISNISILKLISFRENF